jgi:hypothetical protein
MLLGFPAFFAKSVTVDVTAPTITSAAAANNVENNVLAHALTANESVTWSIVGGVDQAKFEISGSTLRWASNGVKDYDSPDDSGANNTYVVDVRATDLASNTADQTITITVLKEFAAALVRKASDQTAADYSAGVILSWDAEVYDTASGFHSGGDPTKLTVPSEFNGQYVVVSAQVEMTSIANNVNVTLEILKGGSSSYNGASGESRLSGVGPGGATTNWVQCSTQPIAVSTGDYFEAKLLTSDTSVTIEAESSTFSIAVVSSSIDGTLVKKASDQTAANFNFTNLTWDTEVYDTGTYHDTGSNTSRITIPAGANGKYGVLKANVRLSSVTASSISWLGIIRASSGDWDGVGMFSKQNTNLSEVWNEVETAPILLATSQIYEAQLQCGDTSTTLEQEYSTFGLQVFNTIQGALVRKAADQTTANFTTPTVVTWDTDLYDTDTIHDTGSNTSRFTVPSALNGKYAVFRCNAYCSLVAANTSGSLQILKNGSAGYDGWGGESRHGGSFTDMYLNCRTQPVLLSTGDYYEAQLYCNDSSVTFKSEFSTFSMMVVGP